MSQTTAVAFTQHAEDLELSTPGEVEIVDLTDRVKRVVENSGVKTGQCNISTVTSTPFPIRERRRSYLGADFHQTAIFLQ